MAYAEDTTVPFERSIGEIITLIKRAGATDLGQVETANAFAIQFALASRAIRFRIPLPQIGAMPTVNGRGQPLSVDQRRDRLAQATRQRGRALLPPPRADG